MFFSINVGQEAKGVIGKEKCIEIQRSLAVKPRVIFEGKSSNNGASFQEGKDYIYFHIPETFGHSTSMDVSVKLVTSGVAGVPGTATKSPD